MAEPLKEFLSWLEENYNPEDVAQWKSMYLTQRGTAGFPGQRQRWQDDPVYQFWTTNVSPAGQEEVELNSLVFAVQEVLDTTDMTEEEANKLLARLADDPDWQTKLYQEFPSVKIGGKDYLEYIGVSQDTRDYLTQYTSAKDLADRINQLDFDQQTKSNLYQNLTGKETAAGMAMRGAGERAITAQEQAQLSREEQAQNLTSALQYTYGNPLVKPEDLKGLAGKTGEDYLSGESDELIRKLEEINMRAQERGAGEEQAAQAIIRQSNRPQPQPDKWQRPPMPGLEETIDPFLKGTYGEGTKLRSFIESEIPDVVKETAQARREWWERMNPEPEPEVPTFESEQARMKGEQGYWQRIASTAPTATSVGGAKTGTYFGPGGLAGIASQAYIDSMRNMTTLRPEDFPEYNSLQQGFAYDPRGPNREPSAGEDPLLTKLRSRDWWERYARQPGVGIVSRLTPSVRF